MSCNLCPLHTTARSVCLMGTGNRRASLLLVGEAPGRDEDLIGKPFVGQAGKLLNHVLNKLGIRREDIFITNLLRCRPKDNKLPPKKELDTYIEACRLYFEKELREINPKVVVLLGATPLKYIGGENFVSRWEGMEIKNTNIRPVVISAFHPAYVLRSPRHEVSLARALAKAAKKAGMKVKRKGIEAGRFMGYDTRM